MVRRSWATGSDSALAGSRYILLIGELHVPELSALRDAMATIAAAGPHTRLALTPQPQKWLWHRDQLAPPPVQPLPEPVAEEGPAAILEYIRSRPGSRGPLEVHASGRYFAIDADHGLGDGHFALQLAAAVFATVDGRATDWVRVPDTRLALPLALVNTFGFHPRRAVVTKEYVAEMRAIRSERPVADSTAYPIPNPWVPTFASAVAHVNASAASAVDGWRRARPAKVNNSAVWLYVIRHAFKAAGLTIAQDARVAFDCRRYLPRWCHARGGNFINVLEIPFSDDDDVSLVDSRIRGSIAGAVPLASMGLLSGRAVIRPGSVYEQSEVQIAGGPAVITYTDMSRITALDDLPWWSEEHNFTALLTPGSPSGLSVFTTSIGATRNISIAYHPNVIDPSLIETAARHLEDPMQFLQGSECDTSPRG